MNISVYLFGSFKSGYSQYPNDYAKTIFEKFYQNAKSTTQVAIHRDGDLMYYGYIRKLEAGNYIGLCTVVNGKCLVSVESLFSVYEGVIESMVKNGYLIHFGDHGEVVTNANRLYENFEEISLITSSLQNSFDRLENKAQPLPPLNYGVSKGTIKDFSIQDNASEIINSSYTNSYTFIYKSKDYNTATLNSYSGIVGRKNKQISDLQTSLDNYKSELQKAKLAQKRFKAVAILSIGLFIISLISITLYQDKKKLGQDLSVTQTELTNTQEDLNNTKGQLNYKNNELTLTEARLKTVINKNEEQTLTIEQQNVKIEQLQNQYQESLSSLENEKYKVSDLQTQLMQSNRKISDLTNQISILTMSTPTITNQDISFKLYNVSHSSWFYSTDSPVWSIEKKRKGNEYLIYIYYKNKAVASQKIEIK